MLKISIPKPCHEDWDKMTPNQQGRHCSVCTKTVTDFTKMSDEAIKNFFINKKAANVCGRFKQEQLDCIAIELPENILYIDMPLWKKFLAACLIAFSITLFSCETKLKGDVMVKEEAFNRYTVNEYNMQREMLPGFIQPPPPDGEIMGVIMMPPVAGKTIDTIAIENEQATMGIIEVADSFNDKETIKNIPEKVDEIKIHPADSVTTKNPAKRDSMDCNEQIFIKP